MSKAIVFSVIESPTHPKLSSLYTELGYEELQFKSVRNAMNALKKHKPDVIVAEFFYPRSFQKQKRNTPSFMQGGQQRCW